jgi:hypothetical protein
MLRTMDTKKPVKIAEAILKAFISGQYTGGDLPGDKKSDW